jgi:hypothetical protein
LASILGRASSDEEDLRLRIGRSSYSWKCLSWNWWRSLTDLVSPTCPQICRTPRAASNTKLSLKIVGKPPLLIEWSISIFCSHSKSGIFCYLWTSRRSRGKSRDSCLCLSRIFRDCREPWSSSGNCLSHKSPESCSISESTIDRMGHWLSFCPLYTLWKTSQDFLFRSYPIVFDSPCSMIDSSGQIRWNLFN